jgi:membrane-associated HD superfamily phosphohydrolase
MNILALIVLLGIIDISKYLSSIHTKFVTRFLSILLLIIFVKTILSVFNCYIPVEFSSVAYLFVPFVFLFRIKKLYVIASYIATLAGAVYYFYIILNGGATYNVVPASYVYISMFAHGTLLLVGLVSMFRLKFNKNNYFLILGYMLLNIIWAISNRPESINFRLFIYELIDGEFLEIFFSNLNSFIYIAYYLLISSFLFGSVKIFNKLNTRWYMSESIK